MNAWRCLIIRFLCLGCLLVTTGCPLDARADTSVEVIPSSRADELVPILAPMAAPEGSVTAWQGQLIIRATPEKLSLIKETLQAVDKPLRNLLVQVRRRNTQSSRQQSLGAGGNVVIRNGQASGRVVIHAEDKQVQEQSRSDYSLRTVEGSTLFIATGTDIPVISFAHGPGGSRITQDYVPVQSGMMVTPRLLADDTVMLTLDFQDASVQQGGHGVINRSGISSQMQLPLNEWTPFGTIYSQQSRQQSDGMGQSRETTTGSTPLEIRIEILP